MKMDWLKLYVDARNDRKLASLTDGQFRVWFNLLCMAGESKERGTVPRMETDLLALEVAGGDTDLLQGTIDKLVKLQILGCHAMSHDLSVTGVTSETLCYYFISWDTRQYEKPSDRPEATAERKRNQRSKQAVGDMSRDVTPGHASHAQRREEEIKTLSAVAPPRSISQEIKTKPVPKPPPEHKESRYQDLWEKVEAWQGYGLVWNFPAEVGAVKDILKAFPDATNEQLVGFLAYKKTCFGVDPAGQPTFSRYKKDFGAWYRGGMPKVQTQNQGQSNGTQEARVIRPQDQEAKDRAAWQLRADALERSGLTKGPAPH